MRTIIIFALLITIGLTYGCNQGGEDDSSTESSNKAEQQKSESADSQQTDAGTENSQTQIEKGKVLATVNGVPIYETDVNGMSLRDAITDEILYQEGVKRGIDKQFEDKVKQYEKSLVVSSMKIDILENQPPEKPVSDEEIQQYYTDNLEKYRNIKLAELNFSDKNKADEIKKMAGEGTTFQEIANNYPDSDVKVRDIGFNKTLTNYFEKVEVGSVTDVIEKKDGTYSVLKIVDIVETPYQSVQKVLRTNVEALRKARAYNEFADNIAEENDYNVEIVKDSNK